MQWPFFLLASQLAFSTWAFEFVRHPFPLPESIWSVEAVDVNGDGQRDLIAMGETKVFALQAPDWNVRVIADTREPKLLYCAALDADGDGDLDFILGRYRVPWIEYRQALASGKTPEKPQGPDFSLAWLENTGSTAGLLKLHVIDTELNGVHGMATGDLNGDGQTDFVAGSILGPTLANRVAWFGGKHPFTRTVLDATADGRPHYLAIGDINQDGRNDIALGDSQGGTFSWWEQADAGFTKRQIAQKRGATNVRIGDMNGDGKIDVIGSCGHGKGVFWFAGPDWTEHPIDLDLPDVHALAAGDFDGDGDLDVAGASFSEGSVKCYLNDGQGHFIAKVIDPGKQQAYDLKAVDLDGDGRLDLILAGRETRNTVWYRNRP